jgi:hypothetical protein
VQNLNDFIKSIDPQDLAEANASGNMDRGSEQLREAELKYIRAKRGLQGFSDGSDGKEIKLTGIALSGGRIRSATFALGVLQALAKRDLLRRFDYLSTVSGGGYIGSSLTWLTSKFAYELYEPAKRQNPDLPVDRIDVDGPPFGLSPSSSGRPPHRAFPCGVDDPSKARVRHPPTGPDRMLRYLRQHGCYLTPGEGITLTSGIAVALRGIILNLLVWIPIAIAVMLALLLFSGKGGGLLWLGKLPNAFQLLLTLGIVSVAGFVLWGLRVVVWVDPGTFRAQGAMS